MLDRPGKINYYVYVANHLDCNTERFENLNLNYNTTTLNLVAYFNPPNTNTHPCTSIFVRTYIDIMHSLTIVIPTKLLTLTIGIT